MFCISPVEYFFNGYFHDLAITGSFNIHLSDGSFDYITVKNTNTGTDIEVPVLRGSQINDLISDIHLGREVNNNALFDAALEVSKRSVER